MVTSWCWTEKIPYTLNNNFNTKTAEPVTIATVAAVVNPLLNIHLTKSLCSLLPQHCNVLLTKKW